MTNDPYSRRRSTTRRGIARDTLTILAGALLAIVVARVAVPPSTAADATGAPLETSGIVGVGSEGPGPTLPPLDTIGAVVNPSAGFQATPTPIPIITLGPPTPSPSIEPSLGPSVKPSPKPTVGPSPTPPPLVASFTCDQAVGAYPAPLDLTCTASATGAVGLVTWAWAWETVNDVPMAGATVQPHHYATNGDYTITLTVTDSVGRKNSFSRCCWSVTVAPASS